MGEKRECDKHHLCYPFLPALLLPIPLSFQPSLLKPCAENKRKHIQQRLGRLLEEVIASKTNNSTDHGLNGMLPR